MIQILSIDPGTKTGAAHYHVPMPSGPFDLRKWWQGPPRTKKETKTHGEWAAEIMREIHRETLKARLPLPWLAVESQFVPSKGGKGQDERHKAVSILKTAQHAGGWIYLAQALGWPVWAERGRFGILATDWRMALYGWSVPPKGVDVDETAIQHVLMRHRIKLPKAKAHAAEAILIGDYVAGKVRRPGAVQQELLK